MPANFKSTKNYNLGEKELLERCALAIKKCNFKIIQTEINTMKAKAPISFYSWGENIILTIDNSGNVTIESTCALKTQMFDWNKNKKNVEKIFRELK